MIKKFIAGTVTMTALAMAMPASATVYELSMSDNSKVTINTETMIGTWIGGAINATFSGAGLASFNLDVPDGYVGLRSADYGVTLSPTSTITGSDGKVYFPTKVHEQRFKTGAVTGDPFSVMLWSYWGPAGCDKCTNIGDYVYKAVSWQTVPSSSGGTSVPEPGMVGLMGLGVLGMAFARRRRVNTSVNMAPLAA